MKYSRITLKHELQKLLKERDITRYRKRELMHEVRTLTHKIRELRGKLKTL